MSDDELLEKCAKMLSSLPNGIDSMIESHRAQYKQLRDEMQKQHPEHPDFNKKIYFSSDLDFSLDKIREELQDFITYLMDKKI